MECKGTKNSLEAKVHFFITDSDFFYFENRDRFLKTDFAIRLGMGQNLGKGTKNLKKSPKRLKT